MLSLRHKGRCLLLLFYLIIKEGVLDLIAEVVIFLLKIVVALIFVFTFIFYLAFSQFGQNYGDDVIVLSFNDFYKYYQLNPKQWKIDYDNLIKISDDSCSSYDSRKTFHCKIKNLSYWKYILFVWKLKHGKKMKKQNKIYIEFLKDVQKDINKRKKEAEKYIKEGKKILEKLTE